MPRRLDEMEPRAALAEIARDFHHRGWMAGTAGNLSSRDRQDPGGFWITASGLPKGRLDQDDFLRIAVESGEVLERFRREAEPSAETAIHRAIYRLFPEAKACLHVHSIDACLATARCPKGGNGLPLPPLEMIKGLDIWEQDPMVVLPLFSNHPDVPRIAADIERHFTIDPPRVPALMIHDHGTTVWGRSLQEAYDRVEVMEFLMSYLARV